MACFQEATEMKTHPNVQDNQKICRFLQSCELYAYISMSGKVELHQDLLLVNNGGLAEGLISVMTEIKETDDLISTEEKLMIRSSRHLLMITFQQI